jgi:pteridine reductase
VRLGRALSLACAQAGMDVWIHYNCSREPAEDLAAELRAGGVRAGTVGGDLGDSDTCRHVVAAAEGGLGGLDVLVSSAANFLHAPFEETTEDMVDQALAVNLKGPFFCAQAAAPGMRARGFGRIVMLADVAGLQPWRRFTAHSVAKAGVVMLTKALALELAPEITVNAIAPGPVLMPDGATQAQIARSAAQTALGRIGSPDDVAQALLYLLRADYVTGEVLVVDGGRMVAG